MPCRTATAPMSSSSSLHLTEQWYVNAAELGEAGDRRGARRQDQFRAEELGKDLFQLDGKHPAVVRVTPALVGPPDTGVVWSGRQGVCRARPKREAQADADKHYGKATPLKRDEDVLDTWFSSALWPFSTLGWPDSDKDVKRFYPTSALVTGFDIIFFWVARMMMMGLYFQKEVPFHDVYIHRLVRDASGAKMSKSKGNVVDPLGVIDEYGADALRFTLARNVAPGHDIRLGPQDVENNRNFATKLWNAARFVEFNGAKRVEGFDPKSAKEALNRWIAHETAKAAAEITQAIETYAFADAAAAAYRFVWNVYCDWYVELSKPLLTGPDGAAKDETRAMAAWALDEILKLLHPFMPFITEELWNVTGQGSLLALTPWPKLEGLTDDKAGSGDRLGDRAHHRWKRLDQGGDERGRSSTAGAGRRFRSRRARVPSDGPDFIKRLARVSEIFVGCGRRRRARCSLSCGWRSRGVAAHWHHRSRRRTCAAGGRKSRKPTADIARIDAVSGNPEALSNALRKTSSRKNAASVLRRSAARAGTAGAGIPRKAHEDISCRRGWWDRTAVDADAGRRWSRSYRQIGRAPAAKVAAIQGNPAPTLGDSRCIRCRCGDARGRGKARTSSSTNSPTAFRAGYRRAMPRRRRATQNSASWARPSCRRRACRWAFKLLHRSEPYAFIYTPPAPVFARRRPIRWRAAAMRGACRDHNVRPGGEGPL